jgi:predicted dienelactone hydrolase
MPLVLADAPAKFSVLLYAPGNGGVKTDSASTAAELASHGYIVVAIDDIDRIDKEPRPLVFDYSSAEAFKDTLTRLLPSSLNHLRHLTRSRF